MKRNVEQLGSFWWLLINFCLEILWVLCRLLTIVNDNLTACDLQLYLLNKWIS